MFACNGIVLFAPYRMRAASAASLGGCDGDGDGDRREANNVWKDRHRGNDASACSCRTEDAR